MTEQGKKKKKRKKEREPRRVVSARRNNPRCLRARFTSNDTMRDVCRRTDCSLSLLFLLFFQRNIYLSYRYRQPIRRRAIVGKFSRLRWLINDDNRLIRTVDRLKILQRFETQENLKLLRTIARTSNAQIMLCMT